MKPVITTQPSKQSIAVTGNEIPTLTITPEQPTIQISGTIFTIDEFWDSGLFWDNGGHWDQGVSAGLPVIGVQNQRPTIAVK